MSKASALPGLIFIVIAAIGLVLAYGEYKSADYGESLLIAASAVVLAAAIAYSVKIANQWEKVVVLRLGRFHALQGPGIFFIIPIIETVPYWIDIRVITTSFKAEKLLQKIPCR